MNGEWKFNDMEKEFETFVGVDAKMDLTSVVLGENPFDNTLVNKFGESSTSVDFCDRSRDSNKDIEENNSLSLLNNV